MSSTNKKIALALGSNLGNRLEMLRGAIREMKLAGLAVTAESRIWETAPWGITGQPRFLNMCVIVESRLEARDLLHCLKAIERQLGRTEAERWGPRVIDIDIIMIENETVDEPGLKVPHPRMRERAFVLVPLAEIAPDMIEPWSGKSVKEIRNALPTEEMDWII